MLALPTMEAFSLLKYWRGGGGGGALLHSGGQGGVSSDSSASKARASSGTTTIVTAVAQNAMDSDEDDDDDEGPFFDLEFAVPEDEDEAEDKEDDDGEHGNQDDNVSTCAEHGEEEGEENDDDDAESDGGGTDVEREFNFTLSSGSSNDRADPNLPLSPSDDLFFKGRFVPIEPSSLELNNGSEPNTKPAQFPVSLLKSATKFRVLMLGFKKSKQSTAEKTESKAEPTRSSSAKQQKPPQQEAKETEIKEKENKFFTVKFKVEEVPIMSLFTRDNSSSRSTSKAVASQKQTTANSSEESASDEKRFSKDVMQKYLRKVKPLYIRVSRRYGEKLRFSGQLSLGSGAKSVPPLPTEVHKPVPPSKPAADDKSAQPPPETTEAAAPVNPKGQKQGNIPAGLRVVCKHLGKSRSASSAVAPGPVLSKRRDDSLLQQQDGIQSAILHCKRSFNASRDSESSVLPRCVSESSGGEKSRKSIKEAKEDGVA